MRAQGSPNARSPATTAHCLYPAGPANQERARRAIFVGRKKGAVMAPALRSIVIPISSPIGIVGRGAAVGFEFAVKHRVVLFADSAGRCGGFLLVGLVQGLMQFLDACFHSSSPSRLFDGPFYKMRGNDFANLLYYTINTVFFQICYYISNEKVA
jgi:hypothetical protein